MWTWGRRKKDKTHVGESLSPPVAIESDSDPAEDVASVLLSTNAVTVGATGDFRLLQTGGVVGADSNLNLLALLLDDLVLALDKVTELHVKLVKHRAGFGVSSQDSSGGRYAE